MPFKKVDERAKVTPVRVAPSIAQHCKTKYGSLGQAIRHLAEGGPYEKALSRVEELEQKLIELTNKDMADATLSWKGDPNAH